MYLYALALCNVDIEMMRTPEDVNAMEVISSFSLSQNDEGSVPSATVIYISASDYCVD